MKPHRFSLTFVILASLSCLLILTWLLLSLISFKTSENDLITQKNGEARLLLASYIHLLAATPSPAEGLTTAGRFAQGLAAEGNFSGLTAVDRDGKVLYRLRDDAKIDARLRNALERGEESFSFSADGMALSRYAPIKSGGVTTGAARLTISLHSEYERLNRSRRIFLAYFILDSLLLLGFGSYLMSRLIVIPVRRLLAATEGIAAGDLGHRVGVPGSAEIAGLAEAFNRMVDALRREREDVARHVDSLERVNMELQSARQEAIRSEKMASIGLLAAGTAHEVGTPLAAIMGYAGILREELGHDPVKSDYLRRIESESARIDRIMRSLLDYARPSAACREAVDVAGLMDGVIALLGEQGVLKRVTVRVERGEGVPPVSADPHQLRQVFINLIINARDAMARGGELEIGFALGDRRTDRGDAAPLAGGVTMGRRRDDFHGAFTNGFRPGARMVKVVIRDSGEGIAAGDLERIFDPFFTTKEPGQGTGLGLSISARIIDSFGGRITVESEPGKGSAFTVWLPAQMEDRRP